MHPDIQAKAWVSKHQKCPALRNLDRKLTGRADNSLWFWCFTRVVGCCMWVAHLLGSTSSWLAAWLYSIATYRWIIKSATKVCLENSFCTCHGRFVRLNLSGLFFVISEQVLWGDCVTSAFDFDFAVTSSKPVLSVLNLNILTSAVDCKDRICHFSVLFVCLVAF